MLAQPVFAGGAFPDEESYVPAEEQCVDDCERKHEQLHDPQPCADFAVTALTHGFLLCVCVVARDQHCAFLMKTTVV